MYLNSVNIFVSFFFAGERQTEAGDDVRDDAQIGGRHVSTNPQRNATLQLRHTHQLPRTCVRIQRVRHFFYRPHSIQF